MESKSKLALEIQKHFPEHKLYAEPFFGAGGMFFHKPKAKFNIMNDLDSEVFNFWLMVSTRKEELEEAIRITPIHSDILQYWKKNKETDPIRKALRFIFFSNYTFMGGGDSIRLGMHNCRQFILNNLNKSFEAIDNVQFYNSDFRKFFSVLREINNNETFIYCDPPYLYTGNNYSNSFSEKDSEDLFNCLEEKKCKWAMSEFNNEFVLSQAEKRNLNIVFIGERNNLKNKRIEILITNYTIQQNLFT